MSKAPDMNIPAPIVTPGGPDELENLLSREWLVTNRLGSYASSTAACCNTRRYHGLLIAATTPPTVRVAALACVMETLSVAGNDFELATNEFNGAFNPHGFEHLAEFRNDTAATFVYRLGGGELIKEILLAERANVVAVRYTLRGGPAVLRVRPFAALRDYHQLRRADGPGRITFEAIEGGVAIEDSTANIPALHCLGGAFRAEPQWWHRFYYRAEHARGQQAHEDLFSPGRFTYELADGGQCQFTAALGEAATGKATEMDFQAELKLRHDRLGSLVKGVGKNADQTTRRLAVAADAFLAARPTADATPSSTILAGYHWFADWGRDAFIALPGLLLTTGQFEAAKEVFATFAGRIREGMIPNRFDEYTASCHYNSIDASLWFIVAAERYMAATGDEAFWRGTLMPAATEILRSYRNGTRFGIHCDTNGLLTGGRRATQLTWMDAKLGEEAITPRHGKAVEVNALWYCSHRILAERCGGIDDKLGESCDQAAGQIASSFAAFWNPKGGYLYDRLGDDGPDDSLRANQIFAVSLPYSPLPADRQASVVRVVAENLLTPYGLRTLSPSDGRYHGQCAGDSESRDRAYHQGTVWAWLIGPFIEAYLKVHGDEPAAPGRAGRYLQAFDEHLSRGGLGTISEIFDGDPPHGPRGCIAQAWSVGELLRAKRLVAAKSN